MNTYLIVQKSKKYNTEYRMVSYNGTSVEVLTVTDFHEYGRKRAWISDRKVYRGPRLRNIGRFLIHDKQYTNLSYNETSLTAYEWMSLLNEMALYPVSDENHPFMRVTYWHWEVNIASLVRYKELTKNSIYRKKKTGEHVFLRESRRADANA